MKNANIAIIGGAGFVGRHLAMELVNQLREVTVICRKREHAKLLFTLPAARIVEADARDVAALTAATRGCDAIVNLVGILYETSRSKFRDQHVGVTEAAIEACRRNGIRRYIHMSALNADPDGPSKYLQSKGEAEQKVATSALDWTIFRPSLIVGPGDQSINTFARIAQWMPVIVVPGASARFQPIFVGDVACAFAASLDDRMTFGQRYPLCGPRVYTLRELFAFAARQMGRKPLILKTPGFLAGLQAMLLEVLPGKPMTRDNLRSLSVDSVSDGTPIALLGRPPVALEDVVPEYLAGQDRNWRYQIYRRRHAAVR